MTDTLETAVLLTLGTHKRGSTNRRSPPSSNPFSHNYRRFHKGKRQLISNVQARLGLPFRFFFPAFSLPFLASLNSKLLAQRRSAPRYPRSSFFSSNLQASVKARSLKLSQALTSPIVSFHWSCSHLGVREHRDDCFKSRVLR